MPEPAEGEADAAESVADGEAESAEVEVEEAEKRRRGSTPAVPLAIVAAVFAVASVVLLLLFLNARKDHDTLAEELKVRTTASRFAEAFVALDSKGALPEQDAVVADLGTGPIVGQHTEAMAALRKAYAAFGAISARAEIKGTYLSQIDESAHEATVLVNLTLNVSGPSQTVPNESYLEVHLVKVGGQWKVDNVIDVRGRLGAQAPASTSTTTTAPGAEPSVTSSSG